MRNPKTMRCRLFAALIAAFVLVGIGLLASLPIGLARDSGGWSAPLKPRPKGMVLYVSPQGDDAWSGKLAEPNAAKTDGPFATIIHARDAIRLLKAQKPLRKPVTVYLRGGVYTLGATVVFLPQDSGTAKCPITYAAYPGEKVVLSGGRAITGWKKSSDERGRASRRTLDRAGARRQRRRVVLSPTLR